MMAGGFRGLVLGAFFVAGWATAAAQLADKPEVPQVAATVTDSAGKEVALTEVKLTTGSRRLAWLADLKGGTSEDAKKGLLALDLREPNSTTFQKGVSTLIPVASVEAIRYDYAKQIVTVSVKGATEPVPGTLQFKGLNVFGLEGRAGSAPTKLAGGTPKDGFRAVIFPSAKPVPVHLPGGLVWSIQIEHPKAGNPTLAVRNLKALYTFPGGVEVLYDAIPARKGDPLPLNATVKKLEFLAVDTNTHVAAVEVTSDAGADRLTAILLTREQAGRTGTLVGLVGEVDVGWKLFPLHTIKTIAPTAGK
jgi:hypothetical protein